MDVFPVKVKLPLKIPFKRGDFFFGFGTYYLYMVFISQNTKMRNFTYIFLLTIVIMSAAASFYFAYQTRNDGNIGMGLTALGSLLVYTILEIIDSFLSENKNK